MSHLESGFCVTDLKSLDEVLKEQCPELELVQQKTYRTWAADCGTLVGDYPLPSLYQLKLMIALKKQGVDVHAQAKAVGVELPANLAELETKPWNLEQQNKLRKDPTFQKAYDALNKDVVGKDATYVIKYKAGKGPAKAYEVGVVQHPLREGEYVMLTDFYNEGNGLLKAKGLGQTVNKPDGSVSWGGQLKQAYAARAAERTIQQQITEGNPEFGSYTKQVLPDGKIKIEVHPREGF